MSDSLTAPSRSLMDSPLCAFYLSIAFCLSACLCLSLCISFSFFLCQSLSSVGVSVSFCPSLSISVCLYLSLSLSLSFSASPCLCLYLSLCLFLCVCLSLCLSQSLPVPSTCPPLCWGQAPHTHRPMWDTFIRLSGTSSLPFFSHTPRTFSSDTSHLNTAWSFAPTVKSAMLWYTSSFFSGGQGTASELGRVCVGVGVNPCGDHVGR